MVKPQYGHKNMFVIRGLGFYCSWNKIYELYICLAWNIIASKITFIHIIVLACKK